MDSRRRLWVPSYSPGDEHDQHSMTAAASAAPAGNPNRWWILAVMLTAEIMDLLDSTVVNVAGPSLKAELGATATSLQWVIGGYPLALGAGLILGGRLGDRFGRRTMFLVGLIGFTVASLACALAPAIGLLITFRLIQGLFGAALLPQGLGLLRAAFPPQDLGKAFAVFGPVFGLGGILGPIIGGGLVQADLFGSSWRLVFLVNVPIGIAASIIALRLLPRGGADRTLSVDLVGAGIVFVSSGLVVLPLIQGQAAGWPIWCWVLLVLGVLGYLLFTVQQRRWLQRGRQPLVTPTIFRKRSYVVGLGGIALFFAGLVGVQLILTLFLQLGERFSAGEAGLSSLPIAIGSGVGGALSGAVLADKIGRGVLQLGAALQLVGAIVLFLCVPHLAGFTVWQIVPGLLIAGIGSGLVVAALFNVLLAAVADDEVGSASGVLSAVQSIASSIGVAVFGTVFFAQVAVGKADAGFRDALIVQGCLLVAFLLLSPLFPHRARDEHEGAPVATEATPA
jgi:EmrB/QacA subfamily drug resistance transporter